MEVTPFEHFEMSLKGIFLKPQRRKADEGVRISHLNPDTRMNSRDEFRQGTNIVMRAVRGLGVWASERQRVWVAEVAQCNPPPAGQPGGEVVTINTVFVTRKEGLRSKSTSTTFPTRSSARRRHVRGACRPWKTKMMQSCTGGEKSRQGGARGRGGEGLSSPGGATL